MSGVGATVKPQDIVERALALSEADGCIVIAEETSEANLRFARNTLTTNGVTRGRRLTVIATVGGQEGTAAGVVSRSNVGLDKLESLVRAAEDAARSAPSAEDAAPLMQQRGDDPGWADEPTVTSIDVFSSVAPALGDAFTAARAGGRDLFGFAEHQISTTYLGSSTGLRVRHDQPTGR